jgi:hypothetical protein
VNGGVSAGSASVGDDDRNHQRRSTPEVRAMLVRRFSILCLAVALAGAGFVTLLQNTDRTPYAWQAETAPACPLGVSRNCLKLVR